MTTKSTPAGRRLRIPVASIRVPPRLRPVDPAWAAAVAESMRETGLTHPVVVRPDEEGTATDYVLVAGMHRLYAADFILGWNEIDAEVRELDDRQAKVVEIDENLMRRELSALDRAVFLAERKRLWEEAHPETKRGGDRKSLKARGKNQTENISVWSSFSKDVAERTGLTERTIRGATALAADLGPELIARLRLSPIADNAAQLKALARLPENFKSAALDPLASGAPSLKAALKLAGMLPAQLPKDERDFRALVATWSRAGAKARRRFLAHIEAAPLGDAPREDEE